MTVVIDPQARGFYDDGSESGAVRSRLVKGDLVSVPFRNGMYVVSSAGSASQGFELADTTVEGMGWPHDGLLVTVPAPTAAGGVLAGNGIKIAWPVYGTVVGIRFWKGYPTLTTARDFVLAVDGVGYRVSVSDLSPYDGSTLSNLFNEACLEVVATDLADTKHYCELIFPSDVVGGQQNQWVIWGYLAERRAGYREYPPIMNLSAGSGGIPASVATASAQTIPMTNTSGRLMRAVRQVIFTNTGVGSSWVRISYNTNVFWEAVLSAAGSAGSSAAFDPGGLMAQDVSHLNAQAQNAGVKMVVVGLY
jgi:hypothetical protein